MKIVTSQKIEDYQIITAISEGSVDPEATRAEIAKQVGHQIDTIHQLPNYRELFQQHKIYFSPGPNQQIVEETAAEVLMQAFSTLEPNQLLLITGEVIPNYLNKKYWTKAKGKWEEQKIEGIGKTPKGILEDDLSSEQREEIRMQQEKNRIGCMTPEAREEELQQKLGALADEAARLEKRAQIQQKDFNPIAWYEEGGTKLYTEYGITKE